MFLRIKSMDERVRLSILGLIYACFVSLGFSEAALGVTWPEMRGDFGLPIESVGVLAGVLKIGGMLSSFAYGYFGSRLNVGKIMMANAALVAFAMFGYAVSTWWALVVMFTVPLGMCTGAVSSAVNGYAARNYSSRQLNWINCVWGVGVTCGTLLLTRILSIGSWRAGYLILASIIAGFAVLFARTLRIWRVQTTARPKRTAHSERAAAPRRIVFPGFRKFRRVFAANCLFTSAYAGVETAPGLWGASLFINVMGSSIETAGFAVSLYWGALTAGRFLAGTVASRFSDAGIIRGGLLIAASGAVLLSATRNAPVATLAFVLIGLGLAPVYPSMIHDIPRRVGDGPSGRLIGVMQGSNYLGAAILPALMGCIASRGSILVMGPSMIILLLIVAASHEVSAFNALYKKARVR
ncbi:MAG: MFS transporter [Synergistaceae bacterium]|jgi:fucose permease|nr:MFS transporter [Synergistaceae bacterium]